LVFTGISPSSHASLEEERAVRGRHIRFRRYVPQQQTLIIVVPGPRHERTHKWLGDKTRDNIVSMVLEDAWMNMGATKHLRGQGHPGGDEDDHKVSGEPDSSGGPSLQRENLTT